ncbi:hypothetical protein SAMD00023353_5900280 [Rosellinia necatrix]|uniref:Uncharacterized protein n=1 Tax=Rosellinia necatrix TaxID=77044 RepID=A0A1W2TAJ3_ROSNE|nr:hypothetical protein SAMD00023353_5900280 [Rosellinia necatrix]
MVSLKFGVALLASSTISLCANLLRPNTAVQVTACTTGRPTTTAGYPMPYYTKVAPKDNFSNGYRPETRWASEHLVGTYNFGAPEPLTTGFAYAQFKCQYYCDNQSVGGSFFVRREDGVGSRCECYDELLDPKTFVDDNETWVGAWNALCMG